MDKDKVSFKLTQIYFETIQVSSSVLTYAINRWHGDKQSSVQVWQLVVSLVAVHGVGCTFLDVESLVYPSGSPVWLLGWGLDLVPGCVVVLGDMVGECRVVMLTHRVFLS